MDGFGAGHEFEGAKGGQTSRQGLGGVGGNEREALDDNARMKSRQGVLSPKREFRALGDQALEEERYKCIGQRVGLGGKRERGGGDGPADDDVGSKIVTLLHRFEKRGVSLGIQQENTGLFAADAYFSAFGEESSYHNGDLRLVRQGCLGAGDSGADGA